MTEENSRMDVNENFPEDLKAMDLSTFNSDITTNLTSKNSKSSQKCWDGVVGSLGTQDFSWHNTDTGVKGRNICHLGIIEIYTTRLSWGNGPKNTA